MPETAQAEDKQQDDKIPAGLPGVFVVVFKALFVVVFKALVKAPADKLVLIALIAVVGVLLYGFLWVIPKAHTEAIGVIQNSNEQQREIDRRDRREESESNRKEQRTENDKLRTTIRTENERTRDAYSKDTEKLRIEFRQGIDEIRRTKSGGGFSPPDDISPPRIKGVSIDE